MELSKKIINVICGMYGLTMIRIVEDIANRDVEVNSGLRPRVYHVIPLFNAYINTVLRNGS